MKVTKENIAKPFIKWAGGKTQLLSEISITIQKNKNDKFTYVEPFIVGKPLYFGCLKIFQTLKKL